MTPDRALRPAVGVIAVAVLLLGGALWVLPGGGAGTTPEPSAPAAVVVDDSPARAQLPPAAPAAESYQVFGGKNPFQRPEGGTPGSPSTSTSIPDGGGGGGTTSTTQPGGGGGGGGGGGSGSTTTTVQPGTDPTRGTTIALVEVFVENGVEKAVVRVDGQLYEVVEGQVFAGRFQVVEIDIVTGCADFLYGDRAFTLCEGQEIIK